MNNQELFTAQPLSLEQRLQRLEEARKNLDTEAAILQKTLNSIDEIRKILLEDAQMQIYEINQQQQDSSTIEAETCENNIRKSDIIDDTADLDEKESDPTDETANINIQDFVLTDNEDELNSQEYELINNTDELNIPDFGLTNDNGEITSEAAADKNENLINETEIIKRIAEEQMRLLAEEEEKRRQQEEDMQKKLAEQQKAEESSFAAELEAKLEEATKAAEMAAADAGSITKQWLNKKTDSDADADADNEAGDNHTIEAVQQLLKQISQQVNR